MLVRWLLPLALVTSAASVWASARAADMLAALAAQQLTLVANVLASSSASSPAAPELEEPPTIFASAPVASPAGKKKPVPAKRPSKPGSVFVSAARVLALVESGARPRGKPVPATARRPAGLRLSGVSALGLGVLDGDVLTEAAGARAVDSGAVIAAVLRARARQQKTIAGTCYRGDERYALVVEQPYLPARGNVKARP